MGKVGSSSARKGSYKFLVFADHAMALSILNVKVNLATAPSYYGDDHWCIGDGDAQAILARCVSLPTGFSIQEIPLKVSFFVPDAWAVGDKRGKLIAHDQQSQHHNTDQHCCDHDEF